MEEHRLQSNIQKVYWLNGTFCFMVLMPIIVPFFNSRGLDMENVYQLQAIFAGFVLLLEVPSGYFSDLVGRKGSLVLASGLHSFGYVIMALAPNFEWMVVSEVFLALSVSLFSGTDLSLLYDSLERLGSKKVAIKAVGRKIFYRNTGESIAGLVGGWLLLWHFEAPAIAQALVGLVPLGIALTLYEPPREKMSHKTHKENFRYIWRSLFGHSRLLTFIFLTGVFYNFATLIAVWAFQSRWQNLGVPIYLFGYLWFLQNIVIALVGRYAHKLEKHLGSEVILMALGVLPVVGWFGMALNQVYLVIIACLCFPVVRGLASVVIADGLNKRVKGDMRATANSIMGLGTRILMVSLGPVVGSMMDQKGHSETFSRVGFVYIFVAAVTIVPLLLMRKDFDPIPRKA